MSWKGGPLARELPGLWLVVAALGFTAFHLASEIEIGRLAPNDATFHLAASERLAGSFARGEPFLDPWVSEWALGYPMWSTYQPFPHLIGAGVLALTAPFARGDAAFAVLQYLLLALLPASVYLGARLLGLGPVAGGLASLLVLAPSEAGEYGRFGIGYGAFVWRGSGLYTQLVAVHLLVPALGLVARALDHGRRSASAALLLALTALSHIVFGYVAFASAALLALVGPRGKGGRRFVRLFAVAGLALVLLAWFIVPLILARHEVNHSRWEAEFKWDSFGARTILGDLARGELLDAGRAPILTLLLALGTAAACLARDVVARRLLALTALWLGLFFGRATWGHLILLAGIPRDLHLHRFEAAFEIAAVLLAAYGVEATIRRLFLFRRPVGVAAAVAFGIALCFLAADRAAYLQVNDAWGRRSIAEVAAERADLDAALGDVRTILAERPGRVSAGLAATWGNDFKVGSVPVYGFLTRAHLDQASFLYHAMSLSSEAMVQRHESDPAHDAVYGIRAVLAPAEREMPPHLIWRGAYGRFAVYESSGEGYFGLVDVGALYVGPRATHYETDAAWLVSPLLRSGIVIALDPGQDGVPPVPALARWQPLPGPATNLGPRGTILEEKKEGETYQARLSVARPCFAFVKIGFHPDLVARVDGEHAPIIRVTPGFCAVPVPAGSHQVVVTFEPGPLRAVLLLAGVVAFGLLARALAASRATRIETSLAAALARGASRFRTPRVAAAGALAITALVALHPLFRGRLIAGHDATEYPPRLVEFARAVGDLHIPPIWAPDLGAGHGQPLFEFSPPLLYAAALPLRVLGAGLADSIQLGVVLLFVLGGAAVYRIGRHLGFSRAASCCSAAAWYFAPYTCLDLYVRSNFLESSALAVAPIALLCLLRAIDRPSARRVALAAAAVALLVLGHNAVALLALPAVAAIALVAAVVPWRGLRPAVAGGLAVVAGLGLAAFFWLPALLERGYVKSELLRQDFLDWREHAVAPWQLLWSPWGFGTSVRGVADGMSFALGPVHVLLACFGAWVVLRSGDRRRRAIGGAALLIALAGAWLATSWSAPIWSRAGILQYLAYPWRALLLPGLLLPLLALPAFERLGARAGVAALAVLVVVNAAHTEPAGYLTFDDEYYSPQSIAEKGINTTTREEYEPRWVQERPPYASERLAVVQGRASIVPRFVGSAREEHEVSAAEPSRLESAIFYYPGLAVAVDGQAVPIEPVPVRGTASFAVPEGRHTVVVRLLPTPLRRGALVASVATLLALGLAVVWPRSRGRPADRDAMAPFR